MNKLITILIIFVVTILYIYIINLVFAENYTYNLTKDEREEYWLSDICLNTEIKIQNCEMITGKIDSDYGEKIK